MPQSPDRDDAERGASSSPAVRPSSDGSSQASNAEVVPVDAGETMTAPAPDGRANPRRADEPTGVTRTKDADQPG